MTLDVQFEETALEFGVKYEEYNQTFAVGFDQKMIVSGASDEHIEEVVEEYLVENKYLKENDLSDAVNGALRIAKESGEFDGRDGIDGKDGKDGEPGYTPVKGVDYFIPTDIDEIVNSVLENFADVSEVGM